MISINVTVHTAGAMEGWDAAAVDVLATEARLAGLLRAAIVDATGADEVTVNVRREDAGDYWDINGAESAREERDLDEAVRDTLMDFPWHDGQRWAVFHYLTTADGRKV